MALFQSTLLAFILCASSYIQTARGLVQHNSSFAPDTILHITSNNVSLACTNRQSILINGSTPGPPVYLQENQTSWIRVYNDMPDQNLTLHWHGLSQSAAPFSDGTPRASQWPIPPSHFFDYELRPSFGEAGSYFYHSHVGFQAVSCAGPLVVEEASGTPPYDYDEERIVFLSETFAKSDSDIVAGLTATPFSWSGEASAVLVNGHSYAVVNATQDNSSCGPDLIPVEPDKTYRFRFIGGVALSLLTMAFEGHDNLTIIGADGAYTQPFQTDHIQIDSGQRFDVLLRTKSRAELLQSNKTSFWLQVETRARPTVVTSYAILAYANVSTSVAEPTVKPLTLATDFWNWLEYSLEPLTPNDFPTAAEVTRRIYISSAQFFLPNNATNGDAQWQVNNQTWRENYTTPILTPYLVAIYENGQASIPPYDPTSLAAYNGWNPTFNAYPALIGEVLEIILVDEPNGRSGGFDIHPWHAHGGHYYDIGSGNGTYNATANEEKLANYHPVKRDTTVLYKFTEGDESELSLAYTGRSWRAWRLRVEDAGVWMIHCHTLQHMIMGMQTIWVMGNATDIISKTLEEANGYLTYGGSAYGNATYDPFVSPHFG